MVRKLISLKWDQKETERLLALYKALGPCYSVIASLLSTKKTPLQVAARLFHLHNAPLESTSNRVFSPPIHMNAKSLMEREMKIKGYEKLADGKWYSFRDNFSIQNPFKMLTANSISGYAKKVKKWKLEKERKAWSLEEDLVIRQGFEEGLGKNIAVKVPGRTWTQIQKRLGKLSIEI